MTLCTLAIVPARGGSRRIPDKNLQTVGGRTLVRRALENCVAAGCFENVVLSSDDARILDEARGLPVLALPRPAALAGDETRSIEVVRHVCAELAQRGVDYDAVAVVQCTSPLTSPADLAGAVALLESSGAASVVSIAQVDTSRHPLKLKRLDADGRLRPYLEEDGLMRSQDLPPFWVRNGSIYVSRREVIDAGSLLDVDDLRGYEMPPERSIDVDTPLDLAIARVLAGDRVPGDGD